MDVLHPSFLYSLVTRGLKVVPVQILHSPTYSPAAECVHVCYDQGVCVLTDNNITEVTC